MFNRGGKNLLLYAVVLGLAAAGSAAWYISTAEASANPTQPVVVAKTRIPARAVVTEEMLTIKKMPRSAVHPEAASTMTPFIGKTTKQTIAASEPILASKVFTNREQTGLAYVLPEGKRAVAINITERTSAGGLIVPGDKVDVIGSCQVERQENGRRTELSRVGYALQEVEVLAVAQDIQGEEPVTAMQNVQAKTAENMLTSTRAPQPKATAKTMTLSLTPDDAQKLILLENHPDCDIRLALRAAGEQSRIQNPVIDFDPAASMTPIIGR